MLELAAAEGGSIVFAIEGNMPEASRINDYVLNGIGDPAGLIGQLPSSRSLPANVVSERLGSVERGAVFFFRSNLTLAGG